LYFSRDNGADGFIKDVKYYELLARRRSSYLAKK
jgi:hypothetical protein